ncbi:translocon-associated protein subunit alpha-like [Zingiber officinale]|uniref:translocon-associated protein subunit alpha-like n=1 Tax=Zingiber officinale TaxID=94328 RepID=UPI001C4B7543|nr:translocon-associated protein subunit alpha-like [Zingiber officinale]
MAIKVFTILLALFLLTTAILQVMQEFYNASVPVSAQATFPYLFAVSKYLQPDSFDLVASIVFEIDSHRYQNVFYNGTDPVVR